MSVHFDIEELRTFVLLAENGHFTTTASALRISQPAVSQRIARLENSLGLMLFTRTAERANLTSYGQRMLDGAKRCVEMHTAMRHRLTQHQRSASGMIRIWIDHSSLGDAFGRLIAQEGGAAPNIERVDSRKGTSWQERLTSFECDLVLSGVFLQSEPPTGIKRIELHKETGLSAIWASDHYPIDAAHFDLSEVIQSTILTKSENMVPGFRGFIRDWCRRAYGYDPKDILEFESTMELLQACKAGFGVCLVPGNVGEHVPALAPGLSSHALFSEVLPNAYIYALHLRNGEFNDMILRTADWITSTFRETQRGITASQTTRLRAV